MFAGLLDQALATDPAPFDKLSLFRVFDHHQLYRECIEPETQRLPAQVFRKTSSLAP